MSKAEERALEAYPISMTPLNYQDLIDMYGGKTEIDTNSFARAYFQEGYEQTEKDLALTWEDCKRIVEIADSMITHTAWDDIEWPDEQKYYEEVLKRFNESKEDEK